MKHFFFLITCLFSLHLLQAQAVVLDSSFAQNGYINTGIYPFNAYGRAFELTSDQELVVAGNRKLGGSSYFSIQRFSSKGDSIGGIFIPVNNFLDIVCTAMKMTSDGAFIIADTGDKIGLMKINSNGQQDTTFGNGGHAPLFYNSINDILITKENRILAAGANLNTFNGILKGGYVNAYNMQGQLDSTFGENGRFRYLKDYLTLFNRIIELPDGKIFVAGCSRESGTGMFHTLVKLLPNGVQDSTFGVNGVVEDFFSGGGENWDVAVQPDQKIVVCGNGEPYKAVIARYLPDGSRDIAFGINGLIEIDELREINDLLVLPNGKLLFYGWRQDTLIRSALVQLLPDGSRDQSFGSNGVFFSPLNEFRPPLQMKLVDNNRIAAIGAINFYTWNSVTTNLQMQGFLLDMNVGVVEPKNSPSLWAYPNPVNDAFTIKFSLETARQMQIDVYDLQGRRVQNLLTQTSFGIGDHEIPMRLNDGLPAGNYLITMFCDGKPAMTVKIVKN